jgi:hypothetical protein
MPVERRKQRRQSERRSADRRADTFDPALRSLQADAVESALAKRDARIEIRCPSDVNAEMEAIAGRFGLTLTTYLLRLHDLAKEKLTEAERK